jgi:hypothetical protein
MRPVRGAVTAAFLATIVAGSAASAQIPDTAADYPPGDAGYHSYAEMREHLQATVAANPQIVRHFSSTASITRGST